MTLPPATLARRLPGSIILPGSSDHIFRGLWQYKGELTGFRHLERGTSASPKRKTNPSISFPKRRDRIYLLDSGVNLEIEIESNRLPASRRGVFLFNLKDEPDFNPINPIIVGMDLPVTLMADIFKGSLTRYAKQPGKRFHH